MKARQHPCLVKNWIFAITKAAKNKNEPKAYINRNDGNWRQTLMTDLSKSRRKKVEKEEECDVSNSATEKCDTLKEEKKRKKKRKT